MEIGNNPVAEQTNHEIVLDLTRVFDAPRELVFKVWADPEHLKGWWGPKGTVINVDSLDFRPGGMFHYSVEGEGGRMWGKFVYREIVEPERIVFVSSFADEKGHTIRAPFSETWPLEILNEVTLTEDEGKTTLRMHGGPLNATELELETFEAMQSSVEKGFAGTLDQLEKYLEVVKR